MSSDGMGATYVFDVSDVVRGVDGNSLTIANMYSGNTSTGVGLLNVTDLQIGWVDSSYISTGDQPVPARGAVLSAGIFAGSTCMRQSARGGFSIQVGDAAKMLVETALTMNQADPSVLIDDDTASPNSIVNITTQTNNGTLQMSATWSGLKLDRTLSAIGDVVSWKETWTNTGSALRGVPFRHRFFYQTGTSQIFVGGSTDIPNAIASASNPTLFMGMPQGGGVGVAAENDWTRLLTG